MPDDATANALRSLRDERVAHDLVAAELQNSIRNAVLTLRAEGVPITDLAVWAGVSRPTIYAWLDGKSAIPPLRT